MNPDKIHDALNMLDDDLIEEVNVLRIKKKKLNNRWVRRIAIAACLCIIIAGIFAANNLGILPLGGAGNNKQQGEMSGNPEGISMVQENHSDAIGKELWETAEYPSVLVKIKGWQEDGFFGTVTGSFDTDTFEVGEDIVVLYGENIGEEISIGDGTESEDGVPESMDFPVGSVVRVWFAKQAGYPESIDTEEPINCIIYAERIALEEDDSE